MVLKFYTNVAKDLKLKFEKFRGLIPTFVKVIGEKLVGGGGSFSPPSCIRVKVPSNILTKNAEWQFLDKNKQVQFLIISNVKVFDSLLSTFSRYYHL